MPDYFFHVAIEVAADPESKEYESGPPNLSHFFSALKPFTNRTTRTQRDRKYDTKSSAPPPYTRLPSNVQGNGNEYQQTDHTTQLNDHRFDTVYLDGVDMNVANKKEGQAAHLNDREQQDLVNRGIGSALTTSYLKGHFSPTNEGDSSTASWGIVHLYRDADPTPSLSLGGSAPYQYSDLWSDTARSHPVKTPHPPPTDAECTTLCILAVPSYMTPADFLAFVGEKTRDAVSHFRMVRTARQNRYMVLMKFRDGKVARKWQAEWNGKVWNAMEPETCHVVFLKSVELVATSPNTKSSSNESTFPQLSADPFNSTANTRPLAPPTPSLIELPTCPVCLERMDETTGLLTIPCQHVFHCTCLQKWSGGGCPVCRYTHDDFSSRTTSLGKKHKKTKKLNADGTFYEYEVPTDDDILECETCHEDSGSLWQCLICGRVGCGRYEGKHAYRHYEESGHLFAMDLSSKRVWDYNGDGYVHRIMVDEERSLPTKEGLPQVNTRELPSDATSDYDTIPAYSKTDQTSIENLALEYTHLLTSQLESQRIYFEEIVARTADKASEASRKAERAESSASAATTRLAQLESENDFVTKGRLPELEKENARLATKTRKLEDMAKEINTRYLSEKSSNEGLLQRIAHLEHTELAQLKTKIRELEEENATKELLMEGLREEHRDAMMQVSMERKLREMVEKGEIEQGELEGAEVTVGRRPLTARERLRVRMEGEREVRKGVKVLKKGKEKAVESVAGAAARAEKAEEVALADYKVPAVEDSADNADEDEGGPNAEAAAGEVDGSSAAGGGRAKKRKSKGKGKGKR